MKYFPIFLDLADQRVLIVGAGEVALRKIELLLKTEARICVVAPEAHAAIAAWHADKRIEWRAREFKPADLDGARLAIVATPHRALNRFIATLAEAKAIAVNVVDDADNSRFIVPAIVDRDPVLVAVSTAGTSPVLARRLRERLEALLPKQLGAAATWLKGLRRSAKTKLRDTDARRRYFESLVDGAPLKRFLDGDSTGARRLAQQLLESGALSPKASGSVTLVGAGPGDAELLTLKALRALQDADVILHDRLVSAEVLDLSRRDAERISVGKTARGASASQEEINSLLIEHAKAGRRVVRLKGGDPFIFGRGGEELEALAQAGIDFSVIPGISAANGCAAYAGIPLTHRDFAHSVTFVTGHGGTEREPDWRALASPGTTTVFYMGLARAQAIAERLMQHGAPAHLPAGIVAQGTQKHQRVITATLGTIADKAASANLDSPALLIVGEVVALHRSLAWFGTEEQSQASRLA